MVRKILFWAHLATGLVAGLAIGIMSFTGAALAFEKDIIAWAERDARQIVPPAVAAPRLGVEEIVGRVQAQRPGERVQSMTVSIDRRDAVLVALPKNVTLGVNPYTGEIREPAAPRTRAFLQTMRAWHVRLNFKPGPGNAGFVINSAANVLFVFLGVSGLVLWWPRAWNLRALRPSLWFVRARGKARDWNWHNVVGFWSLPLLLVFAVSGVVLSYGWAGDLVFRLAGETPPAQGVPPPATPLPRLAVPSAGEASLAPDALLAAAQRARPDWQQITLRLPTARTATVTVKDQAPWPRFRVDTLTLDAFTGEVLRTSGWENLSTGLRARRWIRLLHSGEALGPVVQFLSALACVGGCVLVYTGIALAWRRFFSRAVE